LADRNYIRTEEELQEQLKGLLEIKNIFDELNISFFLSAGTLLGAIREKDFIKWDWNVSISSIDTNFKNKLDDILKKLELLNFTYRLSLKGKNKEFIGIRAKKNGVTYIIENSILSGDWYLRPYHHSPAKYFKKFSEVELRGHKFLSPYPPEKYIEWHYGSDWRTPKRVGHRNEVINPEHKRKG
jgi:phosphorylcholine metabolism protein LicD